MRNRASMPMEAHSSGKVWLSRMLDDAILFLGALIVIAATCAKLQSRRYSTLMIFCTIAFCSSHVICLVMEGGFAKPDVSRHECCDGNP